MLFVEKQGGEAALGRANHITTATAKARAKVRARARAMATAIATAVAIATRTTLYILGVLDFLQQQKQ